MQGNGNPATVMLGLSGFRLLSVSVRDGEIEQAIETVAEEVGCPACAVVAQLHDRRPSWVRDSAHGWAAGHDRVRQAGLAVPGAVVSPPDWDRIQPTGITCAGRAALVLSGAIQFSASVRQDSGRRPAWTPSRTP